MDKLEEVEAQAAILESVIDLIAKAFDEDPRKEPGFKRRAFHCQLAVAFLVEACRCDTTKVIPLVAQLLEVKVVKIIGEAH